MNKKINESLAELFGVLIGDGCISKIKSNSYQSEKTIMLITGSWEKDLSYYKKFIDHAFRKNFNHSGRIYHRKDDNTVRYWISKKETIKWFIDSGLPVGPKSNTIKIPEKIINNKKLATACVRGIFNTDGCIYRRYSKQYKNHTKHYSNYAVIEIKMKSPVLLNQIKYILTELKIKTTIISKNKINAYVLRITSQENITRFMKVIKPRKYHIERYKTITNIHKVESGLVAQPGRAPASISS